MRSISVKIIIYTVFVVTSVISCVKEKVATAISLSDTYVVLSSPGDTHLLVPTVFPVGASYDAIDWFSSDESVITVEDGLVKAGNYGEAIVTASMNGCEALCYVYVRKSEVEQIVVNKKEITIVKGQEEQLKAILSPATADENLVSWLSVDPSVAKVSQDGVVKGEKPGTTNIRAYVGELYAECEVNVEGVPVESISLSVNDAEMFVGNEFVITASVQPYNADYLPQWQSSAASVVTIDENGRMKAVGEGESVVTFKAGDVTAECKLNVLQGRPAKIGDIYYSDGSWSPLPDDRKTAIGVVFWAGNPGIDDATLRNDHPECTNGLVVSTDSYTSNWQTDYSEGNISVGAWAAENRPDLADTRTDKVEDGSINKMVGYNNTCAMLAYNEAQENSQWLLDVAVKLTEHSEKVPAPKGSSGWYIPSAVELGLLRQGETDGCIYDVWKNNIEAKILKQVNSKLALIENASMIHIHDHCWASNEFDETTAYSCMMFNGAVVQAFKVTKPAMSAHFVLAF